MLTLPRFAILASFVFLTSCGVTYNSPKVNEDDTAFDVALIEMTPSVVSRANKSAYAPKRLPAAFSQVATGNNAQANPRVLTLPPAADTSAYKIGIGDVILLATRSTGQTVEQLSGLLAAQSQRQGYTVRDDGAIAIPEVGAVAVEGLTIEEAEERVFQRLVQNQLDPEFSLEIAEFSSKRVSVGGAVAQPQLLPITLNPLYLEEAITSAGGFDLPKDKGGFIGINRSGQTYQIPFQAYFADPNVRKLVLADGDSVFVSGETSDAISVRRAELNERRDNFKAKLELGAADQDHVYLAGEVKQQSRIALPFNNRASLADVFYENGGFPTTTGNPAHIYVLRAKGGENLTAYHLNAKNIVNMAMATTFEMRPNDIIFVQEQPITIWGRALQQAFPTLINAGASSLN